MTPSTLAQPRRSLFWLFAILSIGMFAVGCAGSIPVNEGDDEPPPPKVKTPPAPKDGSSTVAGCDGITEAGSCVDGVATYCDLETGELRRKDCKALGKSCVVDGARGAMCDTVDPGAGGGGEGEETPCTDTGVTVYGSCGGPDGQTAVWCDPGSEQTIVWDCAADGLTCSLDECTTGAFCCGATLPPPPEQNECPDLGFEGECAGNTARWCDGDQLIEKACSNGQTCQVDACAEGAFCCDPPEAPQSECDRLGIRGECTADGHPRWCSNGEIEEVTCAAGKTCQVDACGDGAFCCAP